MGEELHHIDDEFSPSCLPSTEASHDESVAIHLNTPREILGRFEDDAGSVLTAAAGARDSIEQLGHVMAKTLTSATGRVVYVGAGTSGRLGVLDAAEWPPTFGIDADRIVGLIAGGLTALSRAVEGAEDRADFAQADLDTIDLGGSDLVIGISASGGNAYVDTALDRAQALGASRSLITSARSKPPARPRMYHRDRRHRPRTTRGLYPSQSCFCNAHGATACIKPLRDCVRLGLSRQDGRDEADQ